MNQSIQTLWDMLGNTPVDNDGNITTQYLDFEPGTDREYIWLWFERTFNVSIAELQGVHNG